MKKYIFSLLLFFLIPQVLFAQETVRYFKEVGYTESFAHRYEGLWPLLQFDGGDYYTFVLNERFVPTKITFHNGKGSLKMCPDGWATYDLIYDDQGRLIESVFYNTKGEWTKNRHFGFAREIVTYQGAKFSTIFYSSQGKVLKNLARDSKKVLHGL